jgi:hypothetical protein
LSICFTSKAACTHDKTSVDHVTLLCFARCSNVNADLFCH